MSIIKSIAAAASGLILVSCGGSGTEVTERSRLAVGACDPRPEVTGHADFSRVNPVTKAVTHWRYSVEAIVHSDCTVSGEFEEHLDLPTGVTQVVHASITCVTIDPDGRTAYIGGVVDHTMNTNLLPHVTEGFLTVRDNGEGAGDPPDQASVATAGPPGTAEAHCSTHFARVLSPIEHGNIQVRP